MNTMFIVTSFFLLIDYDDQPDFALLLQELMSDDVEWQRQRGSEEQHKVEGQAVPIADLEGQILQKKFKAINVCF